ncbi:MAG: signal peptidase I [Oscillospiraceae bacterium]|nr:signal peptidase I [Oscillospiraceae bacterium]
MGKSVKKSGWFFRDAFEWLESILTALLAIILIFTFIIRLTSVDGDSMLPTLHDEDNLLVTNFFYTPKHNDIVVIYADKLYDHTKGEHGKPIIKRVIGIPGDKIRFDTENGRIYRNDILLEIGTIDGQLYEDGHMINSLTMSSYDLSSTVIVPAGHVLVLGDNRGNSVDSRNMNSHQYVGLVDENFIVGRAFFRISPFKDLGLVS